jgi:hypothetical protein
MRRLFKRSSVQITTGDFAMGRPQCRAKVARTKTYIVKHSNANAGNPKYPGTGISKIFKFSMIGTV